MRMKKWLLSVLVVCCLVWHVSPAQEVETPAQEVESPNTITLPETILIEEPLSTVEEAGVEQDVRVAYNDMSPPIVPDEMGVPKLKSLVPQWAVQQLEWLEPDEVYKYGGRANPQQVSNFIEWTMRILKPTFIPEDLLVHLIPLRNWAVLYRDWIDHGGSDTFIVKYKIQDMVIQISETANYFIVSARDLTQGKRIYSEHVPFVKEMADRLFTAEVRPFSIEEISKSDEPETEELTVGFWSARGELEKKEEAAVQDSEEAEFVSDSVKFCTDGQFVIFQIFKYVWSGQRANPFDPRFSPELSSEIDEAIWALVEKQINEMPQLDTPEKRIEVYERIKTRLVTKQVEEYLGPLLYDYEGNKLTTTIPVALIEGAFSQLNDIQKQHLLEQRKSDEYYIEGLKAFNEKRYDLAVDNWTDALEVDPLNVRCALLLTVAADFLKEKMLQSLGKVDYDNPTLSKAVDALLTHKQAVLRNELSQRREVKKDREIANHRIRAIDFYSRGQFDKAIEEWDEVLTIDPGNPQAQLFKDLARKRLKEMEERQSSEPSSPGMSP